MANDPLQQDLTGGQGNPSQPKPLGADDVVWDAPSHSPTAPSTGSPAAHAQTTEARTQPISADDVEWDAPAVDPKAAPDTASSSMLGKFAQWQEDFLNQYDNPLSFAGNVVLGGEKGVLRSLHDLGGMTSQGLQKIGLHVPDIEWDAPKELEAHGVGQSIGEVGEGVAEFILADNALKGLSLADKLTEAAKVTKTLEKFPRLTAALKTGMGAMRMGAVQAALTGVHGGTVEQALESGAMAGGIGGAFEGAQAAKAITKSPMLAKAITTGELFGGAGLAAGGVKQALTGQQENESPNEATNRQVGGGVNAALALIGMKEGAKTARSAAQDARARQTADWINSIQNDVFWSSPASKGDVSGRPGAGLQDTYRQTIKDAFPQLIESMRKNPTASTPVEFSSALQNRSDTIDSMLKAHAESLQGYDEAVLQGVDNKVLEAVQNFNKDNPGKYSPKELGAALHNTLEFMNQGDPALPESERNPSLFEAENIRQRWNSESAEAPIRGEKSTAQNIVRQIAAGVLRNEIDAKYEELGVKNVQEWRKQQSALIDVKDQIADAQKAMENVQKKSVLGHVAKAAGWATLGFLFPPMHLVGEIFGASEGLNALRDFVTNREKDPQFLLKRAIKNATKLGERQPSGAITPEFTNGVGGLPPKGPSSAQPAATGQQIHDLNVSDDEGLSGVVKAISLRKQIADLGDKLPQLRSQYEAELKDQVAKNNEYYNQPVEIPQVQNIENLNLHTEPEMDKIAEKAGLVYRGSDDMGLSHFHDPETNHTFSALTSKVTPDELIAKRAAKPAPAQGEGSLTAFKKETPQIEGDVPHLINPKAASIDRSPESAARHEYGHVAAAALFPDITATDIVLPGHPKLTASSGHAAATTRMDVTDLYRKGGGKLTPETYPQLIKMAAMGGAVDHLTEGLDYKTNTGLRSDRGYMERILKEVGVPRSDWDGIVDNMYKETIDQLNKPELLDVIKKYASGREPDLDKTVLASNERVKQFTNEFKSVWERANGKITGSTEPTGRAAEANDLGRTESGQPEGAGGNVAGGEGQSAEEHLAELRAKADEGETGSVKGSTVPLMENPLKVKGTGEGGKIMTTDVAKALNQFSKKQNPALKPGSEPAEMVARAKSLAEDEARYQLAQARTGTEWYTKEIDEHDAYNAETNPTLADPVKNSLFKFAEAILSSGQKPFVNLKAAFKAFDTYESNGQFSRNNPNTGKSWGPRGVDAYGYAFDTLNRLVSEKGEKGAVDWLLADHPIKELREMAPNTSIAGKQTDMMPGAMVLGAKRGPFALNLHKIEAQFTADMWVSRTWNRWMGTTEIDPKTGEIMSDAPRNKTERALMKQSFQETADKMGLTTSSLQAVLWYYEQSLYGAHGTPKESWSFSDAAKRVRDEQKAASAQTKTLTKGKK